MTGGLGFIGKHLCKRLLEFGHDVVCLDDASSSTDDAEDFILQGSLENAKFKLVVGSILDRSLLSNLVC